MESLNQKLNYEIKDKNLLQEALTHKSCQNVSCHNERLEFLGDAVLNLIIADKLMEQFPTQNEGDLTKKRAQLINGQTLYEIALSLNLDHYIQTGIQVDKGKRILAGTLEAYIGAIYIEAGFLTVKKIIQKLFEERINENSPSLNYKSSLQEWCQKKYKTLPIYKIKKEEGPHHQKMFYVDVFIKKDHVGSGSDLQKKQAEQIAAKAAITKLKIPSN